MDDPVGSELVASARGAVSRGEWQTAYELFAEADAAQQLGPEDLGVFADAAYAAGQLDVAIETWERIHAQAVAAGARQAAAGAAVRVAMALLFDTALMAPVRGWTSRAERLLEGAIDSPVHAWLAVVRAYERLLSGDLDGGRRWAERAIEVGTKHGEPAAAAIGSVAHARCLIFQGRAQEGLALLDEAAVAAVSGELDPLSVGIVYCEVVCAWQGLAQYDLAEEWTRAMERWRDAHGIGSPSGRCRVHRAEILRLRGESTNAEAEVLRACKELRPYLRREYGWPLTELGRIRLRMGDLRGAEEALLEAHRAGWDPQPWLALLRLAQGDVQGAATSIRAALDHPLDVPSKELPPNTDLRRTPLLEAQVEIAIEAGDLERARHAASELQRIALTYGSTALRAGAALALGRVLLADGDAVAARDAFSDAVRLWSDVGAPYETALTRLGLGHAHRAEGNEAAARLELQAAGSTFEQIGAPHLAEQAMYAREGGEPVSGARRNRADDDEGPALAPEAGNTFRREGDVWLVVFEGRTSRVRDVKGMRYLTRLLADPGREFHAMDLVVGERGAAVESGHPEEDWSWGARDAGPLLDARAKEAYRRRLTEIEEDIDEARALGDTGRAARAETEREWLVKELSRAVGLGGRDRAAVSESERARASVTRAIRHAMARIRALDSTLGEHLDRTVRTGTYCAYLPDPRVPVAWQD